MQITNKSNEQEIMYLSLMPYFKLFLFLHIMPCSLLYLVHEILNIFALFIIFFDVPTLGHAFSCQIMHFMVSKEAHTITTLHL